LFVLSPLAPIKACFEGIYAFRSYAKRLGRGLIADFAAGGRQHIATALIFHVTGTDTGLAVRFYNSGRTCFALIGCFSFWLTGNAGRQKQAGSREEKHRQSGPIDFGHLKLHARAPKKRIAFLKGTVLLWH